MNQPVMIKSSKSGILLILDEKLAFDELLMKIADKFSQSSKFFGSCRLAIQFEGRALSHKEQMAVIEVIETNTDIQILCVAEEDNEQEELFQKALSRRLYEMEEASGQFYRGNIRKGQIIDFETSVIVLGNLEEGAGITSKGNIIVMGSASGELFAGAGGNKKSFIMALDLSPSCLRIADVMVQWPRKQKISLSKKTKIAYLAQDQIQIDTLSREALNKAYGGF